METTGFSVVINPCDPGHTEIIIEGQLVVRNAAAIRDSLLAALNSSHNITVSMRNVMKIDLSVTQLLIALKKSVERSGKSLVFDLDLTESMTLTLARSGITDILKRKVKNAA